MSNTLLPSAIDDAFVTPPSSVKRSKGKPMIVDISIGNNGEQVYKMRRTRTSRKRKNREEDYEASHSSKRTTPNHQILENSSPNTLNQEQRTGSIKDSPSLGSPMADDGNKWSEDVEAAFEEALRMIPKNELTKIKISGKLCGRNELISDYILQKTGKIRTRKQVSSHIQVIKNLRKNSELIELINNGPSNPTDIKKFDEVFTEISFKKSLGNAGPTALDSKPSTPLSLTRRKSRKLTPQAPLQRSKKSPRKVSHRNVIFNVRRFEMSLADIEVPSSSHTYTRRLSHKMDKALRLKPDASVQNRFPNLSDYLLDDISQEEQIPIIHNLVNLRLPNPKKELKGEHATTLQVELKNVANEDDEFGVLTMVYSFGNEVIKLADDVQVIKSVKSQEKPDELKNVTLEVKFAKEFWVAFFNSLENNVHEDKAKAEAQKTIAIKGITMNQVIFNRKRTSGFGKNDIRSILLWEFTRSQGSNDTSSRRLYLPNTKHEELKFLSKLSEPVKEGSLRISSEIKEQILLCSDGDNEEDQEDSEEVEPTTESEGHYQNPVQHFCYKEHQFLPFLETDLQKEEPKLQGSPKRRFEDSETSLSSLDTSLRLDEVVEANPLNNDPQFLRTSSIVYFPLQQSQQLRRMQSASSFWNLQPNQSWPLSTTSTISSDGFHDELSNWNQHAIGFNPTLTLGYLHLDHNMPLKMEHEFRTPGEGFQQW